MIRTKIVNVVATASLEQQIDLAELGQFKEIFHDSNVYGGRVAYFKKPNMTGKVSIFPSGKMISIGTKNERDAFKELENAKDFLIKREFIKPTLIQPKTQNIVLTMDFQKPINIEELIVDYKVIYEPEQFPGAILRINQPYKATVLIFASGKIVLTGLNDTNQIEPTVEPLKAIVEKFAYVKT